MKKSFWYCTNCHEEVEEEDRTYNDKHKRCGHNLEYIIPDKED